MRAARRLQTCSGRLQRLVFPRARLGILKSRRMARRLAALGRVCLSSSCVPCWPARHPRAVLMGQLATTRLFAHLWWPRRSLNPVFFLLACQASFSQGQADDQLGHQVAEVVSCVACTLKLAAFGCQVGEADHQQLEHQQLEHQLAQAVSSFSDPSCVAKTPKLAGRWGKRTISLDIAWPEAVSWFAAYELQTYSSWLPGGAGGRSASKRSGG